MKDTPEAKNLQQLKDKIMQIYVDGLIGSDDATEMISRVRWAEEYERRRQDTYQFRIKSRLESLLP